MGSQGRGAERYQHLRGGEWQSRVLNCKYGSRIAITGPELQSRVHDRLVYEAMVSGLRFGSRWAAVAERYQHLAGAVMKGSSKEGSYLRLVDFPITQL